MVSSVGHLQLSVEILWEAYVAKGIFLSPRCPRAARAAGAAAPAAPAAPAPLSVETKRRKRRRSFAAGNFLMASNAQSDRRYAQRVVSCTGTAERKNSGG